MTKKKSSQESSPDSNLSIFQPQSDLRNSALWQEGKPDARLVRLIHLLAQVAVIEHLEAECDANRGKKKSRQLGTIKK